jgi:hypothetical protein
VPSSAVSRTTFLRTPSDAGFLDGGRLFLMRCRVLFGADHCSAAAVVPDMIEHASVLLVHVRFWAQVKDQSG